MFSDADLPDRCLASVSGETIFEEQNTSIAPISNFLDKEIESYSQRMVALHRDHVRHAEKLMQASHTIL